MPIKLTDPEALRKLQDKLNNLTTLQEQMKGINKICRDSKLSEDEKTKKLSASYDLSPETIHDLLHPKYTREIGVPSYQFTNGSAEIRRLKKRIDEVIRYQGEVATAEETGKMPEFEFDGGSIIDNISANRIQIIFSDKPNADVRSKLKMRGFRWAPSNNAWQSFRNPHTLEWAKGEFAVKIAE